MPPRKTAGSGMYNYSIDSPNSGDESHASSERRKRPRADQPAGAAAAAAAPVAGSGTGTGTGTGSGSGSGSRRTSKACENCRVRRTRCVRASVDAETCEACKELGLTSTCVVRVKARPNRALPKLLGGVSVIQLQENERRDRSHHDFLDRGTRGRINPSPPPPHRPFDPATASGQRHARFVEDIESSLEQWASARGHTLNLSIPDTSNLSPYLVSPLIPPPDPINERRAIDTFNRSAGTYFDFLPAQRIVDLTARYHFSPTSLAEDQRALVRACVALGIYRERCWPIGEENWHWGDNKVRVYPGENVSPEYKSPTFARNAKDLGLHQEAGYYHAAMDGLQRWGSASTTALVALHILHLFVLACGGPREMREVLRRMVWQVTELGLHRTATARGYPESDRVDRLFFMTLYKDSWFAALCGHPPFLKYGDFDRIHSDGIFGTHDMGRGGLEALPFLLELVLFENELATLVATPGKERQFSTEAVIALEQRWGEWMVSMRDDQVLNERPLLHAYCTIRFNWLRLMLRSPFLTSSHLRLSSLSIIARAASQILYAYDSFSRTPHFLPTYGEARRIATSGCMVCVCFWERELGRREAEGLMGLCDDLMKRLEDRGCEGIKGKREQMGQLCLLLGLNPITPTPDPRPRRVSMGGELSMYPVTLSPSHPREAEVIAEPVVGYQPTDGTSGNVPDSAVLPDIEGFPFALDWTFPLVGFEPWTGEDEFGLRAGEEERGGDGGGGGTVVGRDAASRNGNGHGSGGANESLGLMGMFDHLDAYGQEGFGLER